MNKYKDGRTKGGEVKWTASSVRNILRSERRCGDVLAQKTYTEDYLTHKFNCKPQFFLKSGEVEQRIRDGRYIYNPTPYTASPVLRFSFPNSEDGGSITINGVTMSIQRPGTAGDFIIDCECQDIYMRDTRKNMISWINSALTYAAPHVVTRNGASSSYGLECIC